MSATAANAIITDELRERRERVFRLPYGGLGAPRWSPDDQRIAFQAVVYLARTELHVLDIESGENRLVAEMPRFSVDFAREKLFYLREPEQIERYLEGHARRFVHGRLAPALPHNDGRQTPMRGHPVFVAQHATASCWSISLPRISYLAWVAASAGMFGALASALLI